MLPSIYILALIILREGLIQFHTLMIKDRLAMFMLINAATTSIPHKCTKKVLASIGQFQAILSVS